MLSAVSSPVWRVRALFGAALLLLPLQILVDETLGEPFPGVAMPGFRGTGAHRGGALRETTFALVYGLADGSERRVGLQELFEEFPASARSNVRNVLCPPRAGRPPRHVPALPGWKASLRHRDTPEGQRELAGWLRGRALSLGIDEPLWFECRSFRDRLRWRGEDLSRKRRAGDVRRVDL